MVEETKQVTQEVQNDEVSVKDSVKDDVQSKTEQSMAGVKEVVHNEQAIALSPKDEPTSDKIKVMPSFFIDTQEKISVDVDIVFDKTSGKILSISKKGMLDSDTLDEYKTLGHSSEKFVFTQPDYEDLTTYRQRSATYRREIQRMVVDTLQMRNFLVVWHLKDWSIRNEKGEKIELVCESNGALSDESIRVVYRVNPAILDVVLSNFEKDILLV